MAYAFVILPLALDSGYHYKIPEGLLGKIKVGHRVSVSFGKKRIYTAIVVDIQNVLPECISTNKVKYIDDVLDAEPILSKDIIDLMWWLSDYYICPIGLVLQSILPNELLPNSKTLISLNVDFVANKPLSDLQNKILDILSETKGNTLALDKIQDRINSSAVKVFEQLIDLGAIYQKEYIVDTFKQKTKRCIYISEDIQNKGSIEIVVDKLKRTKSQQKVFLQILDMVYEGYYDTNNDNIYSSVIPIDDITKGDKNIYNAVKNLLTKGIVKECFIEVSRLCVKNDSLVSDAYDVRDLPPLNNGVNLLWAKNYKEREFEILLRVRQTLDDGKSVILLSPSVYELPSSRAFINSLERCASPNKVFYYHRFISSNKRIELFKCINKEEDAVLILGTRGALFLPICNLGLIIVDQEHEFLYKEQLRNPKYHTRDVAIMRSVFTGAKLMLTSETPSVETVFNSLRKKYSLLGSMNPLSQSKHINKVSVDIVDISKERRQNKIEYSSSISSVAKHYISETLSDNKKVLVIQNRKGHTPYIICNECGESVKCPNCDVNLNYNREKHLLVCHYCGYQTVLYNECRQCGYKGNIDKGISTFRSFGVGSQKVEDELNSIFHNANIIRIDSDSLQSKQNRNIIHSKIENDDADIIIGTPIIRSQPVWNNIGLILIVQLDSIIGFPDFRATERAYQFIYNVISSSMYGQIHNDLNVIVQTNNPNNPFVNIIMSGNYNKFVHTQLSERELFKFPPFYRLTKIIMKDNDLNKLDSASFYLYSYIKDSLKTSIVSPVYTPSISKIDNKYYKEIIIRRRFDLDYKRESEEIKKGILKLRASNKSFRTINIIVDRDPL